MKKLITSIPSAFRQDPAACLIYVAAFGMGLSLPLARGFICLTGIMLLINIIRRKQRLFFPLSAWFCLAFCIIAAVATIYGIRPSKGLPKLHKLAWFLTIPIAASVITDYSRLRRFIIAFVTGASLLSIHVCIGNPLSAWKKLQSGRETDFVTSLINNSSLSDGQRLALAILAGILLILSCRSIYREKVTWVAVTLIITLGEIICLKRGPWIAVILCGSKLLADSIGWKRLVLYGALAFSMLLSLPPVSTRIAQIRNDIDPSHGGRMTMWTRIAPELLREHPAGVGFRSLRNKDLRKIYKHIEPRQDHLHSNIIQILVATGPHGLIIFLIWISLALHDSYRTMKNAESFPDNLRFPAKAPFILLSALLLIGLIEYNIADARLLLVYGSLMGIGARLKHNNGPANQPVGPPRQGRPDAR